MSELSERIKMAERQAYFRAHEKEYPFPLDGTNWARLIREKQFLERHPHCRCDSCQNLLTRLHDKDSLLIRQRKMIMKALHHWFLQEATLGNIFWTEQLSSQELAKHKLNTRKFGRLITNLQETEKEWLANDTYCKGRAESEFNGKGLQNQLESNEETNKLLAETETNISKWLKETNAENPPAEDSSERTNSLQVLTWDI